MNIWQSVKSNKYFRIIAAYLMIGWVLMQVAEVMGPALRLPDWVLSATAFLLITTLPVVLLVTWVLAQKEREAMSAAAGNAGKSRTMDYAIYGGAVLALAFVVGRWLLIPAEPGSPAARGDTTAAPAAEVEFAATPDAATAQPAATSAATTGEVSIAVLPFEDLSREMDQEYFSDGITEEIIHALARIDGLPVTARTSSFAFKGQHQDLKKVGELLGVSHILEGSVRKQADQVRITAQLIDTSTGFHEWSEVYDRSLQNIFSVQEEIALAIADKLQLLVNTRSGNDAGLLRNVDPAAYELYLQGRYLLATPLAENAANAQQMLQEAVETDPKYAEAWAALAYSYGINNVYGQQGEAASLDMAELYALRAQALNPDLVDPYIVLAMVEAQKHDYISMRQQLEKALSIDADNPHATLWYAYNRFQTGQIEDSLSYFEKAIDLDPIPPQNYLFYASALIALEQLDEATRQLNRARSVGFLPANMPLAEIALLEGDTETAVSRARSVMNLLFRQIGTENISVIAEGVFGNGDKQAALGAIDAAINDPGVGMQIMFPNFLLMLDETEQAFGLFENVEYALDLPFFAGLWGPLGKDARQHPDFPAFAERIGLVAYWSEYGWPDLCRPADGGALVCD